MVQTHALAQRSSLRTTETERSPAMPRRMPAQHGHELDRATLRSALSGAGAPVDGVVRADVERATGVGLEDVRLHTGPAVRVAALAATAAAFTMGGDIGVRSAPGRTAPTSLVRHELIHVAQRRLAGTSAPGEPAAGRSGGPAAAERQAIAGAEDLATLGELVASDADVAFAAEDWLTSTPDLRAYGYTDLVDELRAVEEWLNRQIASSPEVDRMEEARAALTAEIRRRDRAIAGQDRPARGGPDRRRRAAAPPEEPVPGGEMPRVLRERASLVTTDPVEARLEVDRITDWLQRPGLDPEDRGILRSELATLAPLVGHDLEQARSDRQQQRLARALRPAAGTDRSAVLANLRMLETVAPYSELPGMSYVLHDGEMLVFPSEIATQARAQARDALLQGARRTQGLLDSAEYRMSEHMRLNYEEHPYVGFVVSLWSEEEAVDVQRHMLDPHTDGLMLLRRFRSAERRGSLVDMAEALFEAVEKADQAYDIVITGIETAIDAAGRIQRGMEITSAVAFTVVLSVAAIYAAPVVAGYVAGTGVTGLLAGTATTLGTGATVGGLGFGLGFAGGAGGELATGGTLEEAVGAGLSEGRRVGAQGAAIGLGGGATTVLGGTFGVAAQGLSRGQRVLRGAAAGGGGGSLSGASAGGFSAPEGRRLEAMTTGALTGGLFGAFGGAAGTYSTGLSSRAARYGVGTVLPSAVTGGVEYARTGNLADALAAGGQGLAIGGIAMRFAPTPSSPAQQRAFAMGRATRAQLRSSANTARSGVAAIGLGLAQVPALRGGDSPGVTILSTPGSGVAMTAPRAVSATPAAPVGVAPSAPTAVTAPVTAPTTAVTAPVTAPTAAAVTAPATAPASVTVGPAAAPTASAIAQSATATLSTSPAPGAPSATADNDWSGVFTEPSAPDTPLTSAAVAAREAARLFPGAGLLAGTYSTAPSVRREFGMSGAEYEAAHIVASTMGAAINRAAPGTYGKHRALAILLPRRLHRAFDFGVQRADGSRAGGWVGRWNRLVANGQRTTVADARRLLQSAIDEIPPELVTARERGALHLAVEDSFLQLGVPDDLVLFGGP